MVKFLVETNFIYLFVSVDLPAGTETWEGAGGDGPPQRLRWGTEVP
jgi:hypothetical protein